MIEELLNEKKNLEKEVAQIILASLLSNVDQIIKNASEKNGVNVITYSLDNTDTKSLKELADHIREKTQNSVGLLASRNEGKLGFVVFVSDDLLNKYKAGALIGEVAKVAGGGGGGRPHMATAGGKDISKLNEAIAKFRELI